MLNQFMFLPINIMREIRKNLLLIDRGVRSSSIVTITVINKEEGLT